MQNELITWLIDTVSLLCIAAVVWVVMKVVGG